MANRTTTRKATVYPRVCGGTIHKRKTHVQERGLSPRVRGNHERSTSSAGRDGSIPACAGEPHRIERLALGSGVYPRVCGGTSYKFGTAMENNGLSPRVRGNPLVAVQFLRSRRSIPACAGEPTKSVPSCGASGVYPRVCGGTVLVPVPATKVEGLSPRVRGNLVIALDMGGVPGSIPACAGEPSMQFLHLFLSWVYPRVCGGT